MTTEPTEWFATGDLNLLCDFDRVTQSIVASAMISMSTCYTKPSAMLMKIKNIPTTCGSGFNGFRCNVNAKADVENFHTLEWCSQHVWRSSSISKLRKLKQLTN